MLSDKGENYHLINEGKHTLPPCCLTSSPSLPPSCCLFFLSLAHQQILTDLGKGRQLYCSRCAGAVSVRSSAFPRFSHRRSEAASWIDWWMTCLAGLRLSDRRFPRVLLLMEFAAGAESRIQITLPSPCFLSFLPFSNSERRGGRKWHFD